MTTRLPSATYLAHLRRDSARFVDVLAGADPGGRVVSCPDWTAADLLHHLTGVQWFWGTVVAQRLTTTDEVQALEAPPRAPSHPAMLDAMRAATDLLTSALASTAPETPGWTWAAEQTVGFIYRRQAHEALIHRVDAELAAGTRTSLDPALATDGIDEVLRVMCGPAPWGVITPDPERRIRFQTLDTGASWVARTARVTGTDDEGIVHDEPDLDVVDDDGAPVLAEVRATAADLDCWLWRRPPWNEPTLTGDPGLLATLVELLEA